MGERPTVGAARLAGLIGLLALTSCALVPPNSFLDPTKVGRFGLDTREAGIRRILSPRETPPGIASASEPTPDDLVPAYSDYRIGSGDVLAVTINGLFDMNQPYSAVVEVSALGEIRIPDLGSVRVTGLTEQELEQELAARLKESGLLPKPVVIAMVQQKRGRTFHIVGAVRGAGPYAIGQPDLRLLEAIGMAGDADANSRRAYVIRHEGPVSTGTPAPASKPEQGWVIPPPEPEPVAPPGGMLTTAGLAPQDERPVASQPPPTSRELDEVLRPATTPSRPASKAAASSAETAGLRPYVYDPQTGQVMEAGPPPGGAPPAAPAWGEQEPAAPPENLEKPFDWEDVQDVALEQRVIAIDLTELKAGNPRYNIVVRDRDVINVPIDTGVFYIMGEVNRPGVYAFGGREITVKQALAITGGFAPMAWPQRCDLIRREPGTDKQITRTVDLDAIFAGLEEDFFLRDDDVLNVGTHMVAPFLYVIRNSFRFTYGFGFVYDRNFADKDAYSAKVNPQVLDQQRRAARGLSF